MSHDDNGRSVCDEHVPLRIIASNVSYLLKYTYTIISNILRVRSLVISLLLPALAKHFHLFGLLARDLLEWHLMSRQHLGFRGHTTGKPPSTHLLLARPPVLLVVVTVGQLRILVY
jgi:hypothetical protein